MQTLMRRSCNGKARAILILALSAAIPPIGVAQTTDVLSWQGKFQFHGKDTYGPLAVVGFAASAAVLQATNSPREWGQGGAAYGERFASLAGASGIHTVLATGLDSALHQDPRYYRSTGTGFWRRSVHAFRSTVLTRTDAGGETFSTWRFGSAYGSAFLSNLWYPDRLNTFRLGAGQGTVTLAVGFAKNLGVEFWPDVKRKILHR